VDRRCSTTRSDEESGVLRATIEQGSRPGAALLLCGALLIVPLLLLQNNSTASATPKGGGASPGGSVPALASGASSSTSGSRGGPVPAWKLASETKATSVGAPVTPTTTSPPTTAPPTTTTSPPVSVPAAAVVDRSVAVPTTTPPPPTTTTPTTAPPVAATDSSVQYGQVTYYAHPAGTCASPFLPFGTVVRVTNPANGLSTTCLVNDREADTARSIDLATATFALLAPLSQGVIDAQLSW